MSVTVYWDNPQQNIIIHAFKDPWTVDEHVAGLRTAYKMAAAQPHTVHVIADMRQTVCIPTQLMLAFPTAEQQLPSNAGLLVIVDAPEPIQAIVDTAKRFLPRVIKKLHFVDTFDEMYRLVRDFEAAQAAQRRFPA